MRTFSWCEIVGKRFPVCHVQLDGTIVEVGIFLLTLKNTSFGLNFAHLNFSILSTEFLLLILLLIILSPFF